MFRRFRPLSPVLPAAGVFLFAAAASAGGGFSFSAEWDESGETVVWTAENNGSDLIEDLRVSAPFPPFFPDGDEIASAPVSLYDRQLARGKLPGRCGAASDTPLCLSWFSAGGSACTNWQILPPAAAPAAAPRAFALDFSADAPPDADGLPFSFSAMPLGGATGTVMVRLLLPSGVSVEPADAGGDPLRFVFDGRRGLQGESFRLRAPHGARGTVWAAVTATSADAERVELLPLPFDLPAAVPAQDPAPRRDPPRLPGAVPAALAALALAAAWRRRRRSGGAGEGSGAPAWEELAAVAFATAILAWMLRAGLALEGNLNLGGDTPAHHVLVDEIARSGRPVSWSPAWWGGFPAFRYYFPLPYAAMALASAAIGHGAALNLGSILGLLLLPLSLWGAARLARLPRPAPAFLAALALPLALDNTHTMWGCNAYSALSGMIANAWSFALFPVALGLAARDARRARASVSSASVFAALALSHFFTAVLAAASVAALALALAAARRRRAAAALAADGALAALLAAWWWVPLFATGAWAVAFGEQWTIDFWRQLPPLLSPGLLAAAAAAAAFAAVRPAPDLPRAPRAFAVLHAFLFVFSLLLFFFGRRIGDVFVNCRLWPFLAYAASAGVALAFAAAARRLRVPRLGAAAFFALCLARAWNVGAGGDPDGYWARTNSTRSWAENNFAGLPAQPGAAAFSNLVEAVRAAAGRGRVAWDLHPGAEDAFGSTRAFEALPHLVPGAETLEGGIVNSAVGSLGVYTVQGEVSETTAGWPLLAKPKRFDPASGLRHLEAFGAGLFLARATSVQAAFEADPGWERVLTAGDTGRWRVYRSLAADPGARLRAWRGEAVRFYEAGPEPQRDIAAWWAARGATAHPMALLLPGQQPPPDVEVRPHEAFVRDLAALAAADPPPPGWLDANTVPVPAVPGPDRGGETVFEPPAGPAILVETWSPGLRVRPVGPDAAGRAVAGPYLLASGQALFFGDGGRVAVRRARLPSERLGLALSLLGLLAGAGALRAARRRGEGAA